MTLSDRNCYWQAMVVVESMQKAGVAPDRITLSTLIDGAASSVDVDTAFKVRHLIKKKSLLAYTNIYDYTKAHRQFESQS